MPLNPLSGLFARAFKFVDQFSPGQTITREALDEAIDDLVPSLNLGLEQRAAAEAAALAAQGHAEAAATAGAAAGATAGAEAATIAAAEQVAQAAVFANQADEARQEAEDFAASINPLNLVAAATETAFTGNLDTLDPANRITAYRLAAGVTGGPAGAGDADFLFHMKTDANRAMQILFESGDVSVIQFRVKVAGVWGAWNRTMTTTGDQVLNGGYSTVAVDDGTRTAGTYRPSPVGGNTRRIVNGGPFTIAAPNVAGDYSMVVQMTNNASAGAVAFSGFSKVVGSAITTTNGHDFFIFITKVNDFTLASVEALQ